MKKKFTKKQNLIKNNASSSVRAHCSTSRGLSAGSKNLCAPLDPADKPRDVEYRDELLPLSKKFPYLYLLLLLIVVYLIYSNALHNGLLDFDDNEYYADYPEITHLSWHSIKRYFSSYYVIMYQPLPVLTLAINYYFTHLEPVPLHMVNLFCHLLNVLLVYIFIDKLSGKSLVALITATLFAVHPMNVEAVSWISARSSSMYTFFYILAMIGYLNYLNFRQKKYLIFTGGAFLFALFSKSQAVTLPLVLLLLDYYYARINKVTQPYLRSINLIFIEKIPFFILSLLFGMITILNKDTINNITDGMLINYTPVEIILLSCYSLFFYIQKLLIPINLCAIHVYPPRINGHLPILYYLFPILLLSVTFLLSRLAKKRRYIGFGALLFLITISINIQIIPSRPFIVSERYGYLPYIGFFFIISEFYYELLEKQLKIGLFLKQLIISVSIIILLIYLGLTSQRNTLWKDNISLMTDIINKNPPVPYLARAYGTRANALWAKNDLQNAITDYAKAIEIDPIDAMSYFNRALLYMEIKQYSEAINDLDKAIMKRPNAGIMYSRRGMAKYYLQNNKGALEDFNTAIRLKPDSVEAYNIRAITRFSFNDYQGSEEDFNQAIRLNPANSELYKNRGVLYLKLEQIDKACKDLKIASNRGDASATRVLQQYC